MLESVSAISIASEVTPQSGSARLWNIAATAVFVEHLLLCNDPPWEFQVSQLSWWAVALLNAALDEVLNELTACGVVLRRESKAGSSELVYRLAQLRGPDIVQDLSRREDVMELLAKICEPLERMNLDWLQSLQRMVASIHDVLAETIDWIDVSPLKNTKVQMAVMFGEDWSIPYDVSWEANGAAMTILMPDVPKFTERHFEHYREIAGHSGRGHTLLYQYLGTFLIPCHEVLHLVQHLHGALEDTDPRSYAMEHDASRLNYVLMWQVLQCQREHAEVVKWVLMLEGINRSLFMQQKFANRYADKYEDYQRWVASFGLDSPDSSFASAGDDEALSLEALSKYLVAGHALGVCLASEAPPGPHDPMPVPSAEHLKMLLHTAFGRERQGLVYSTDNRAYVGKALPESLRLVDASAAMRRLVAAPCRADRRLESVLSRLRSLV